MTSIFLKQSILVAFATVLVVELAVRLPVLLHVKDLQSLASSIKKVLLSKFIPDYQKERVLPIYAWRLFRESIILFCLILVVFFPVVSVVWLGEMLGLPLDNILFTLSGIATTSLYAATYLFLRNRFVRKI